MKLLTITTDEYSGFEEFFEETRNVELDKVAPHVIEGEPGVKFNGSSIEEYDAVYARIPCMNAVFGRVLLEMIEEKGIKVNYPSTAFFIMSKKNYLYHVLHEKNVPAPRTAVVASEKAGRNIGEDLDFPVIARRFKELEENEKRLLEDREKVEEFLDGTNYPEEVIIFHELVEGDKYRCLYTGGDIISLEDTTEGWKVKEKQLQYSNLSQDLSELVEKAAKAIGSPVAEVILRGEKVVDVNPNPDLENYTEVSGKDAFKAVAESLKKGEEE